MLAGPLVRLRGRQALASPAEVVCTSMRTWVCVGVRQYRDTRICTASMEPRASIFVAPEDAEA